MGTVALAAGATSVGYTLVAIRMTPIGDERERSQDISIATSWPLEFFIGGGLGSSELSDWTVRVWLAASEGEVDPTPGAPHAEEVIDTYCAGGNCQVAHGLALVLAP